MTELDRSAWRGIVAVYGVVIIVMSLLVAVEHLLTTYGDVLLSTVVRHLPTLPVLAWAGLGIVVGSLMIVVSVFGEVLWS